MRSQVREGQGQWGPGTPAPPSPPGGLSYCPPLGVTAPARWPLLTTILSLQTGNCSFPPVLSLTRMVTASHCYQPLSTVMSCCVFFFSPLKQWTHICKQQNLPKWSNFWCHLFPSRTLYHAANNIHRPFTPLMEGSRYINCVDWKTVNCSTCWKAYKSREV